MDNKEIDENKHTYDNGFHPKKVVLKDNYKFYPTSIGSKIIKRITTRLTQFVLIFYKKLFLGYKVVGRKNKKYANGSIILCNHVHPVDGLLQVSSLNLRNLYVTILQSNLGFPLVSLYFRCGGAVPIPEDLKLYSRFIKETKEVIKTGAGIIVYPEASLMPYCDHIRPFKNGAFHFAYNSEATILPCVMTYHKPKGLYKLIRRNKPCIHYNILEPYTIKKLDSKKQTIENACNEVNKIMTDYFNKNSDYIKKNLSDA